MTINVVPWVMAVISAAWFGLLACRTGRNWIPAAITGGIFALFATTFVFGLGQATSTPFSNQERASMSLLWTFISAGIVGAVGSLFTFVLWKAPISPPGENPAPTAPEPRKSTAPPSSGVL